ncbi:carboxymuconolactone decarboxylase family protein [Vibrio coralliilyticus]|uniref:carboxymuconolactone decarboxylase family protein n=1 Tax=Vibrio coralliilyticus TaxID=190893 RepID=UPI0006CC73D4|nr:carboxymuconolactone decarboxylase family protein [Vibrio coralliilyticus]AXN30085.1 carboxymuconolactone decarboxylase family protein [Vibrio coralliilyticus]KPH25421.1 alkylhydroperoxidase [Vibrio coralliilyticus]NOH53177.1 carboxymuconolactone decarboxylase family protein [Vibrio coralliilyticus]NOI28162.1 carboxymuconolactone decarboxylase family protein [Vibrio coralliilyticus]NOI49103.1 carboxymuconolactone decarboxylase family protein [Vibrio coralliilyticus]
MTPRLNYFNAAPEGIQILMEQENYLRTQFEQQNTLSITTWELVKLRVSQINQCAFCIDMHSKDALKQGESYSRLIGLNAWQDMPEYSDEEKVALHWSECITKGGDVDESAYQATLNTFGEQGLVILTLAINAINSWNRIAKTFKPEIGSLSAE